MENIELPDEEEVDELDLSIEANELSPDPEPVPQETVLPKDDDGKQEADYSKKVSKRINKLVGERNYERDENLRLRERLDKLEVAAQASSDLAEQNSIDAKVSDIKSRRLQYMDKGDFEEAEALNEELIDIKIEGKQARKKTESQNVQPEAPKEAYDLPNAQKKWMDENQWFSTSPDGSKSVYAKAIYQEIISEGFDPNDEDLYVELDSRLGKENKPKGESPPTPAIPDRGQSSGSANAKSLTNRDIKRMREYGIDPNVQSNRDEWLKNKKAA